MAKSSEGQPNEMEAATAPTGLRSDIEVDATTSIRSLSEALLNETEALRRQIDNSQLQQGLGELRRNAELFRAMSEAALTGGFQVPMASTGRQPSPEKPGGCGCSGGSASGCGPAAKSTCCIELYISMVEVIDGQGGVEFADRDELEIMAAVQAGGQSWGLVPGLNSSINVSKKAGGVATNAPIGRFCVPCGECRTIPLVAQAHEVEENIAGGRAEYGSAPGFITVRCDCEVAPVKITVSLEGGGNAGGIVSIQVSARFVASSCCGY